MLGALEALERGTTAIVDHHASPNAIEGSLSVIADACAEVGVRVSCCYEVTDRNGPTACGPGSRERALPSFGWARACRRPCLFHALRGHARGSGRAGIRPRPGVHIHVAEDRMDSAAGERLEAMTTDDWLLAHCVHLDRPLRGTVAHNPRSNMNNAVGYARPARLANRVVLRNRRIGGDMLEEFRIAYVRHREDDVTATPMPHGPGSRAAAPFSPRPPRTESVGATSRSTRGISPSRPECSLSRSS